MTLLHDLLVHQFESDARPQLRGCHRRFSESSTYAGEFKRLLEHEYHQPEIGKPL